MGKVIVPIGNHSEGLHMGHTAVLDFAKTFPGTHVVKVGGRRNMWSTYLTTGTEFVPEKTSSKLVQDIVDKDFLIEDQSIFHVTESWRVPMLRRATAFVSLYKDFLLTEENVQSAIAIVMGASAFQHSTRDRNDIIVKGPDVASFFQKSVNKLGNSVDIEIFPKIIKNSTTRIKEQSSFNKILPHYHQFVNRIRYMLDGAKDRYKIGKNDKLVQELNDAYALRAWKIKNILIFEGGFVPGHLEIAQFEFPATEGTIMIEEIDYESK